jgi:hypothetical protein
MTNAEYKTFLVKLEQHFPAFAEWLKRPGHDWKAMSQAFYEGLQEQQVTLLESLDVLKGWNTGSIEGAPVGFENQRFLANLLSAVRELRARERARQFRKEWSRDILGECQDLPIRSKVPNKGPLVGRMVEEFERMRSMKLSKGLATV